MSLGLLGFKTYQRGENCPIERIVSSVEVCKYASALLGLKYKGPPAGDPNNYPAGCYWLNTTAQNNDTESYWNSVVDPSQTKPGSFGDRGGVCINGKFRIVIERNIFT